MSLQEKAKQITRKLEALYLAFRRPDTPWAAKALLAFTIGYALSPIDLIPDFLPVLGYLDDIILLPLLITVCVRLIPKEILLECEEQAGELWQEGKPKRWYYGIPVALIWLLIIGGIAFVLLK